MQKTSLSISIILLISTFVFLAPTITRADHASPAAVGARELLAAAEREDWDSVKLYAKRIHHPLLAEYALWLLIQHGKTKSPSPKFQALLIVTRHGRARVNSAT